MTDPGLNTAPSSSAGWRQRLYTVVFESDTPAGRRFDLAVLVAIVTSVLVVVLDSVPRFHVEYARLFLGMEIAFTALFTVEYIVRILCSPQPGRYITSAFGIIDLIALLPTLLVVFVPGVHYLLDIRLLRLFRIFRILKIPRYFDEANVLVTSLLHARRKIMVFVGAVMILVVILGTIMHVVEGPASGFTSIPVSMYWAVVTMTTTGYGDLTPRTPLGQFITSITILLGYGIIALPTGIVGAEMAVTMLRKEFAGKTCASCARTSHDDDARFCAHCGAALPTSP